MILNGKDKVRLGTEEARVLFTEAEIRQRVTEMGNALRETLEGEIPIFIALLNGGFVFQADLIRAFDAPHEVDFLKVTRYDPTQKDPTAVRVLHDLRSNIRDRVVVVVEGVRAKGTKIEYVDRFLKLHQPKRLLYCAMIHPSGANESVVLNQIGFRIDDTYVVGYGLDYREQHRNLPFICALESAVANNPAAFE
jgi:hypoxanthine phosphoribosyltransferase